MFVCLFVFLFQFGEHNQKLAGQKKVGGWVGGWEEIEEEATTTTTATTTAAAAAAAATTKEKLIPGKN